MYWQSLHFCAWCWYSCAAKKVPNQRFSIEERFSVPNALRCNPLSKLYSLRQARVSGRGVSVHSANGSTLLPKQPGSPLSIAVAQEKSGSIFVLLSYTDNEGKLHKDLATEDLKTIIGLINMENWIVARAYCHSDTALCHGSVYFTINVRLPGSSISMSHITILRIIPPLAQDIAKHLESKAVEQADRAICCVTWGPVVLGCISYSCFWIFIKFSTLLL